MITASEDKPQSAQRKRCSLTVGDVTQTHALFVFPDDDKIVAVASNSETVAYMRDVHTPNRSNLRRVCLFEPCHLSCQVHPVHIDNFRDVKTGCADDALSLANVGPVGVHIAHSNLEQGRPLCHGFDPEEWHVSNGPHQRR